MYVITCNGLRCADDGNWGVLDGWDDEVQVAEILRRFRRKMRQWWWKSAATAVERAENGVKDIVKMVALCALQKFPRTAAEKFGTIQASTR